MAGAGTISGLTIGQSGSQVRGLAIENCAYRGFTITAGGNVQVAGCFIGTDTTGGTAAPNVTGLVIENSSNLIGGPNVGDRDIISGNSQDGLDVLDQAGNPLNIEPTGNRIENNDIGLDAAGTKALGNFGPGVRDNGSGDTYGGTTAGLGNVISGNKTGGLNAGGNVKIEGNFIGTDATGNAALGNTGGFGGIGSVQDLGGAPVLSVTITNNLVSGNDYGIYVTESSQKSRAIYTIANNLIGTNAAGTAAVGNALQRLAIAGSDNVSVQKNVISGNEMGLSITGCTADVVQGNLIGTDKTGQVALGNTTGGIVLENSTGNLIGGTGTGQGNVIADNNGIGIEVNGGQQNQITQNSIYGNTSVRIYVDPSVGQPVPAPVLSFMPGTGSTGTLSGTLKASPSVAYTIEIFSDPSPAAVGPEQGKTFIQDVTVHTDSSGKGSFTLTEPVGYYAATATDPSGSTSPFSSVIGSQPLAASQTALSSSSPSTAGQSVTFTAVVTASGYSGMPTGTVTFTIDGHAQTPVALAVVGGADEAQFTTSTLAAGSHTVSASYSGDTNVAGSSGSLPTQAVNPVSAKPITTWLQSSSNPSTTGQAVTFTATVSPGTSPGTPTGTITFTIDGTTEPPVPLRMVGGRDQAVFSVATLAPGSHTIVATYNGDAAFAASMASHPLTQTVTPASLPATTPIVPPTVLESLKRYGTRARRTTLVLTFSAALDPNRASNPADYLITRSHGRPIRIRSVAYNPATRTTTLTPRTKISLHRTYHVTVIGTGPGGVTDARGVLLDGAGDGQAGRNFLKTLTRSNLVIAPAAGPKPASGTR